MLPKLMLAQSPFRNSGVDKTLGRCLVYLAISPIIALALSSWAGFALAQDESPQRQGNATNGEPAARGKYLVENVAMCGQCHTPTDNNGNPDRTQWLQGAPVPWLPSTPDPKWPLKAPRIGGTPPANDADMIKLLTTGVWTTGNRLRSPMPQFRMNRSDAEAVVAYLKSLVPRH